MSWKKNQRRLGQGKLQRESTAEILEVRSLLSAAGGLAEHVPGEILVQYKPQTAAVGLQQARAAVNGSLLETIHTNVMQRQGMGVLERLQLGAGVTVPQAIAALKHNPLVAYAEPNYIYRAAAVSNDTSYTNGSLWGMYSGDSPSAIGPAGTTNQYGSAAEQAWDNNITGSRSVLVGIIDEGIQTTHPDLNDNIWVNPYEIAGDGVDNDGNGYVDDRHGWDFVSNDNTVYDAGQDAHGTHVAGTIGGEGGNSSGVVGVNWSVTMISAKFLGTNGGSLANAVRAVDYLTDLKVRHGLNIVASNNSWGGGGYSQALHDAIIRGAKQDILFVAAAGNSTSNNDATASYPSNYNTTVGTSTQTAASYDAVIAVASITNTGAISSFSSYGATTVDIGAPGSSIVSSVPVDTYANYSGTSMATPHVTGAVALFASAQSGRIAASAIRSAILDSAVPTTALAGKTVTGGRLNVYEALRRSSFIDLDKTVYGPTQSAIITVANSASNVDPNAADSITVTVRSSTETIPLSVTLTETGASTGVFSGAVQLASGAAVADNLLQVSHNDTITANLAGLNLTDTATVDAVAPTISGLSAAPASTSAVITFSTSETSSSVVRFGTSPQSLNRTANGSSSATSHSVSLVGLSAGTVYYYEVTVRDAAANSFASSIQTFTTGAPAPILFVDDDMGATYERFFTGALNANSLAFDTWTVATAGTTPTSAELGMYDVVIWNTGYEYSAAGSGLAAAEQTAISGYLDAGGRIFISGQDVLYNGVSTTFLQNYLKLTGYTNDVVSAAHTETGVAGNAITDGMSLSVAAPSDFPSLYVDAVTPAAGATGLLQHGVTTASSPFSGVSYRGNYAAGGFGMVFSTVPFESLSTTAAAPNNQNEFLRRTIAFLSDAPTTAGIQVSAPSSSTTTESGGQSTFTVVLLSQPSADVTIPVSSSDTTEGTVSPAALVFTPGNWNTPQTVTATGVNDLLDDGNIVWTAVLGAASSADAVYNGLDASDVQLTNTDDDTAGITVSAATGTVTTEAGGAVSFTVKLNSEPTADVTIAISSSDLTEGVVSVASLTFTAANWSVLQTVTATGVNDLVDDGNIVWTVVIGAASSADAAYNGLNPADVQLSNTDDDTAGITVSAPTGTVTTEAGGAVSFTVKLNSEPTADVTFAISSSDTTEGVVSVASLTFTAANWSALQTVTVTGVDDAVFDGNIAYSVVIGAAASTDAVYNGINPADIGLTNNDDDPAPATKFYAVDDATADRTFEYTESGSLIEFYSINSTNTAPRGIATVTAGDRLWVVDAARRVFIYDNSGVLLGSWSAGTLATNATVEGIATDGTHIWIVDARADRVYYYANAASRLSGSQTATTNFALASGNAGPKDIVFGSQSGVNYLWVVNDAASDRVFRYTLNASGVSTGSTSWLINSANSRPTGITVDPSNGSMDIWISDNNKDRVYRYANGRTATAPTLTSSFALAVASGNGNVQGIADPPPAAVESVLPGYRAEVSAEHGESAPAVVAGSQFSREERAEERVSDENTTLVAIPSRSGSVRSGSAQRPATVLSGNRRAGGLDGAWASAGEESSVNFAEAEELDSIFSELSDAVGNWMWK
jgi:subtilisin family serine protease